jgi:hypothetical protein
VKHCATPEFSHFVFDRPGDDELEPIWAHLNAVAHDEAAAMAIAAGEVFGGVNAVTGVQAQKLADEIAAMPTIESAVTQMPEMA